MIHYHGTPLGGRSLDRPAFLCKRSAFVSFYRPDDIEVVAECCRSFAIDNGAFSAWQSGEPIKDWSPYYEFVRKWIKHPGFDWAIIPDVIDGTEEENDKQISKWFNWQGWRGIAQSDKQRWHLNARSVPVWHLHESIDRLVRLTRGFDRVAFGSSGEFATVGTVRWNARMHEAFEAICVDGRPISRVHGLRMLDPAVFHRFPFASCDSTNVARNANREGKGHRVSDALAREIIAERIESHNSAATYVPAEDQKTFFWEQKEIAQ